MTAPLFVSLLVVAVLLVYLVIAVRTWARIRGARLVVCPETKQPVVVNVDVGHAVASALWERPEVRLTSCDRWSERGGCAQPCVRQIETTPDATHGFAVPTKNVMVSLDPGETTTVEFVADKPGTYSFYCTEFCSALHLEMQGWLIVEK